MRRTLFILFPSFMLAVCASARASDLEAVQKSIQEAWSRHKSMTVRVRMESHRTKEDAVHDGRGEGQVEVLRKGDKYVQRSQVRTEIRRIAADVEDSAALPLDITIILDGESEYYSRGSGGQQFHVKVPVNPGISIVPQTVIEFLDESDELKALPEQDIDGQKVWVIEGMRDEPDAKSGTVRTVLYFLQDSGALRRKEVYDAASTRLELIDYSDFQFDVDLDPQRFVFEAPPGATVIDRTRKGGATTQATQPGETASQPAKKSPVVGYLPGPTSRPAEPTTRPAAPAEPSKDASQP